jgi:hypothetical protein
MRCKDCSLVRGYPYKRSHLVALRPNNAEYAPEPNPETKKKDVVWFAPNDDRPLTAFAGIWTEFKGDRGTKSKPIPSPSQSPALTSYTAF